MNTSATATASLNDKKESKAAAHNVVVVASDAPLPSPPTLGADGEALLRHWHDWAGGAQRFSSPATVGLDSLYDVEIQAMTSPEVRALGVEVVDASALMALRSDAHTEEAQDSNTAVHTCLPGPIDDVNSLILNLACYRDVGGEGEGGE